MIAPADFVAGLLALVRQAAREGAAEALATHAEPAPSSSRLLNRREMAERLRVSAATVTRLTAEGMPCTHVGDSPRYDFEAVRAWLAARGPKPTSTAATKRETTPGVRLLSRARRVAT